MSALGSIASSSRAVVEVSQPLVRAVASETAATAIPLQSGVTTSGTTIGDPGREFVRVSSSIGRAASAGQLSRQEAVDIYRQIASLL